MHQAKVRSSLRVSGKFCRHGSPHCGTCSCLCISTEERLGKGFSIDFAEDYADRKFNRNSLYLVQQVFIYFLGL